MSRMVLHSEPVALMLPGTSISEGVHRGKELPDDHPFCTDPQFAWLFEEQPEDRTDQPIETGSARPGERRTTRRPDRPVGGR